MSREQAHVLDLGAVEFHIATVAIANSGDDGARHNVDPRTGVADASNCVARGPRGIVTGSKSSTHRMRMVLSRAEHMPDVGSTRGDECPLRLWPP